MSERRAYRNKGEFAQQIELSTDLSIVLTTNPFLDKLTEMIANTPLDWDYIKATADELSFNESGNRIGKCAEIHLNNILEQISRLDISQKRIILNPIPEDAETQNFHFSSRKGAFIATKVDTKDALAEYDAIIEVDGLPVVWEIKTNNKKQRKNKNGGLNRSLVDGKITALFSPLREFYGTNTFGYVVVTMPENISHISGFQNDFRQRGGIIIGLPTNYDEFKQKADMPLEDKLEALQKRYNQRT